MPSLVQKDMQYRQETVQSIVQFHDAADRAVLWSSPRLLLKATLTFKPALIESWNTVRSYWGSFVYLNLSSLLAIKIQFDQSPPHIDLCVPQ